MMDDVNGTLTKYQNGPGIDNKLKLATGTTSKYFVSDHLGSTNALTNSTGAITSSASYDSFGNQTGNLATRYSYTGREFDSFSGLNYYRARWYDANIGRFISEDPIGFEGGDVNLYAYTRNRVVNRNDPLGLDDTEEDFPSSGLPPGGSWIPGERRWGSVYDHTFGDGGFFTGQTMDEFFTASQRAKIKCKSTWWQRTKFNFRETNDALPGFGAPSVAPGLGLGALTSRSVAGAFGTMTPLQWAMNGFRGATLGGVSAGAIGNFIGVTLAFEAGVGIGSGFNAAFGFHDYCPCGEE